jgi:hypothetical protein
MPSPHLAMCTSKFFRLTLHGNSLEAQQTERLIACVHQDPSQNFGAVYCQGVKA